MSFFFIIDHEPIRQKFPGEAIKFQEIIQYFQKRFKIPVDF